MLWPFAGSSFSTSVVIMLPEENKIEITCMV